MECRAGPVVVRVAVLRGHFLGEEEGACFINTMSSVY
jgi:hypothetical protein